MKKIILIFFFGSASIIPLHSQEVLRIQNGALITIQDGGELTLHGGITIDNGAAVSNNGIILLNNNSVSSQSNWLDNTISGALSGMGLVIFNSTGSQGFSGNTSFYNMQMNSSGNLTLNTNLTVLNILTFKTGIIHTGNNYLFINNSNAASLVSDASNSNYSSSWVNGNLRRLITPNTSIYDFPVGNTSRSNLLQFINNNISGTGFLTATFKPKPGTDAGLNAYEGAAYTSVNEGGVWHLTPDVGPSGGNYALHLYFNGFTGLTDNRFGILQRPDASSDASDWEVPQGSQLEPLNGAGRKLSDGFARRKNLSTFSQWGIGMSSAILPVTGLDFTATRINASGVSLKWKTNTETNNSGFEVQRRKSGEANFNSIAWVPTLANGGNSQQAISYSFLDNNPDPQASYYRVKQIDVDGKVQFSKILSVHGKVLEAGILVWPNPNKGSFYVSSNLGYQNFPASLYDMNGKLVARLFLTGVQPLHIQNLNPGMYMLIIQDSQDDNILLRQKVVVF